jgi:hypothetical protein
MSANAKTPAIKVTPPGVADQTRRTPRKARFDISPYLFILPFVVFCLALLPLEVARFNFEFQDAR